MARFNSIQDCAQTASDIQNACNFSGILHTFVEVFTYMKNDLGMSRDEVNTHPITIVFLDKLNSLAEIQNMGCERVMNALNEVDKLCQ